jgi:hypothetical protein
MDRQELDRKDRENYSLDIENRNSTGRTQGELQAGY